MHLYFDIETAPVDNVEAYVSIEDITAPKNYSDPAKIAAYIATKQREQVSKAALQPDTNRIVALGWHRDGRLHATTCQDQTQEALALHEFWTVMTGEDQLVGYNCLGFDIPTLLRRSLYLQVLTPDIQINRFRHPKVIDLMQVLSYDGLLTYRSLDWYCRRFDLDVPADDVTGADIGALVEANNWGAIEGHVSADVIKTVRLAERIGQGEKTRG